MSHDHPHDHPHPHPHPQVAPPPPDWFQRNWRWALPVGCLGAFALFLAFTAGLIMVIFASIKNSDAYLRAVEQAQAHPAVTEALGEPIEPGIFVTGNISVSGPSGTADLSIPLEGPNTTGTLYVVATKEVGEWIFHRLELELASGERIDLLADGAAPEMF